MSAHQEVRDRLLTFLAQQPLGELDKLVPDSVAIHLRQCEACFGWWGELKALAEDAYGDTLPAAPTYPAPDLSFLGSPSPQAGLPSALLDTLSRFVVNFPSSFLTTLQQPSVAGALRGQFVLRQRFELEQAPGVAVTIEVMGRNADLAATLCIACERLERDPLDQAGSRITLRTREGEWRGITDATGNVRFDEVPLALLPHARIEVEPETPP